MGGIIAGKHYVVTNAATDTFRLATFDANGTATAVATTGNDNDATVTLLKSRKH